MKREIKYLLLASNLWYFGSGLLGPLFAVFTQRVGGDIFSISYVWGIYLVTMGICTILVGRLSDYYISKEAFVLSGYALNVLLTFGYLLVRSPIDLLLVQAGLGLAYALAAPTWNALYSQHLGEKDGGYLWGLSSGFEKIVTGIAIFIGGFIVTQFSFETLFVVMGCLQVLAFAVQAKAFSHQKSM